MMVSLKSGGMEFNAHCLASFVRSLTRKVKRWAKSLGKAKFGQHRITLELSRPVGKAQFQLVDIGREELLDDVAEIALWGLHFFAPLRLPF